MKPANRFTRFSLARMAAIMTLACGVLADAEAAATIVIVNLNVAGEGFNDATPAPPVGGATG